MLGGKVGLYVSPNICRGSAGVHEPLVTENYSEVPWASTQKALSGESFLRNALWIHTGWLRWGIPSSMASGCLHPWMQLHFSFARSDDTYIIPIISLKSDIDFLRQFALGRKLVASSSTSLISQSSSVTSVRVRQHYWIYSLAERLRMPWGPTSLPTSNRRATPNCRT